MTGLTHRLETKELPENDEDLVCELGDADDWQTKGMWIELECISYNT